MDGCTEGESGAEGGVVSPPASARPAENLGDREGGREKELVPGWWVVAGGEYGVGSAALRAGAPTQPKRTNAVILSWPTVESSDAAAFDSSGFRISLQIRFNSREYN
jgi:hypothetical protein